MGDDQLHLDISEYLLHEIEEGNYHTGDKLPSENTLCQMFHTNHSVVRQAIKRLIDTGRVVSLQGKGSFVTSKPDPVPYVLSPDTGFSHNLKSQGVDHMSRLLKWKKRSSSPEEALKLQLSQDHCVYDLCILRFIDGRPASLSNSIINADLVPRLSDYLSDFHSLYQIFNHYFHIYPVRRQSTIQAIIPGKEEAKLLQLPENVPVVWIESLACQTGGAPLEITRSQTRSDMYRYVVKF